MHLHRGLASLCVLAATVSCGSADAISDAGAAPSASGHPVGEGATSIVRGRVLLGPVCPNEPAEPAPQASPCGPHPLAKAVVNVLRDGASVARATTSTRGRFTFRLAPGHYRITATAPKGAPGHGASADVVAHDRPSHVVLVIDSGIR